jgi:simple sugar transport system permease protein
MPLSADMEVLGVSRSRAIATAVLRERPETGALVAATALIVVFSFWANHFLELDSIASMAKVTAELAILAMAVTALMIGGEFDLSVGSILGFSSTLVPWLMIHAPLPAGAAIACGLAAGLLMGVINGIIVVTTRLVHRAAAHLERSPAADEVRQLDVRQRRQRAGSPQPRRPGRSGPGDAVRAGGLSAALVGVIQLGEYNSVDSLRGSGLELNAIAATAIGGARLYGGYGSAIGTALGCIIVAVINNGLILAGVASYWYSLAIGLLIVLSVVINQLLRRRNPVA